MSDELSKFTKILLESLKNEFSKDYGINIPKPYPPDLTARGKLKACQKIIQEILQAGYTHKEIAKILLDKKFNPQLKMIIDINPEEIRKELERRRKGRTGAKETSEIVKPEAEEASEQDTSPIRHYLTPHIHALIQQRLNVWMVGPAGSGKSKMAEQAAEQNGLPFFAPPIGRETAISQLFGYFNAQGQYVRTPLRQAVELGGVIHLEEIDFASPSVGTALNALLANDFVGFPDQTIKKHENFVLLASANTFGTGATAKYIGSQGLNAATLDRFVFVHVPYDNKMEMRLAPNKAWCNHVQDMRKRAENLKINHVISPRATLQGGKMINSKAFTFEETERMVLFKGLDEVVIDKIKNHNI